MADAKKQVPENVPGEYFVDTTCIDCDTCRQLAPQVFAETGKYAYVHHQPAAEEDHRQALRALVSCPTGSIGSTGSHSARQVMTDFPLLVEDPVYYCGFTSPKSYGGSSYLFRHAEGNWLIDSPKFLPQLVKRMEELGGIANIFLTHRDDVADAERYAERFQSSRIIHREELDSQPDAEQVIEGFDPVELAPGFVAIPTPGHTEGHCCLLVQDRWLFTGDHLSWSRHQGRLKASRSHCWYSWKVQTESMARLAEYPFEWVLPGHGQRVQLPRQEMQSQMQSLIQRMQE